MGHYFASYDKVNKNSETDVFQGFQAFNEFVKYLGDKQGVTQSNIADYKQKLQDKLKQFKYDIDLPVLMTALWTTQVKLNNKELCSHINHCIRNDEKEDIKKVMPICVL